MVRRRVAMPASLIAALVFAAVTLGPHAVAGQTGSAAPASAQKAPSGGGGATRTARRSVSARTPWGDPDLTGNYTTKDEMNTPMERPDEFAGRRIEDVTPQELAVLVAARQKNAVETAPFITGSRADGIAIGVPIHWLDHLEAVNSRPWLVIDPPDGKIPPRTEESQQRTGPISGFETQGARGRSVSDSYIDRSNGDRCIAFGGPNMVAGLYGASYQILQTKDYVAIRYEMIHETRMIPIEGRGAARPHPTTNIRSYFGDAIAKWDGNTLVIDTTNFNDKTAYRGARAENLHLIERVTRTGPNKLELKVTIEDQSVYTRPWTYALPLTEDDGQPIFEYACHEGNYGLRNILAGGREDQKRGIEPSNGPARPDVGEFEN